MFKKLTDNQLIMFTHQHNWWNIQPFHTRKSYKLFRSVHLRSTQNLLLDTVWLQSNRKHVQFKAWIFSPVLELVAPQRRMCLFGLGEAHPVVLSIEDGVVLADEHVSQDPQGPGGGGDVQTHEAAQTHGLSGLSDLFDWGEGESQKRGLLTCWKINQRNKHGRPNPPPPGRAERNKAALVCFFYDATHSHCCVVSVGSSSLSPPAG